MLSFAREVAGLIGVGLASYGAWLAYHPAGYMVAGSLLIAGAALLARSDADPDREDNS